MFLLAALVIASGVTLLAVWPVVTHPALPASVRRGVSVLIGIAILGGGVTLYIVLGVPQLAVL